MKTVIGVPQQAPAPSLNRYVTERPDQAAAACARKEVLWRVAAAVSIAAFLVLSAAATLATGVLAPIYLPVTAVALFSVTPIGVQLHSWLSSQSMLAQNNREVEADAAAEWKKLTAPSHIEEALRRIEVNPRSLPHLDRVKSAVARCLYWKEAAPKKLDAQIAKLTAQAAKNRDPERLAEMRDEILLLRDQKLICKVKAAYMRALILRPTIQKDISDVCSLELRGFGDRAIANHFGDETTANAFIRFKDKTMGTISLKEAARLSIAELSESLARAL
jgi:hypothetical protein